MQNTENSEEKKKESTIDARGSALLLIIIGLGLSIPRFLFRFLAPIFIVIGSPIACIGFLLVALGSTSNGRFFLQNHLNSRSIIRRSAGILSLALGWFPLLIEVLFGFFAIRTIYSGIRYGYMILIGPTFIPYIIFFPLSPVMLGVVFFVRALAILSLGKPSYKVYHMIGACILYFIGGVIPLLSIPFILPVITQSIQEFIQLGIDEAEFLWQFPPIIQTLGFFWILFSIVIVLGILFEIQTMLQD